MYPGVEYRLLRYVIAVAEELHFSRAALRLRVSQPTLSKQIRDLEDYLGVQLFDRTNRQVRLTPAGRTFVKQARRSLTLSDRAVQTAKGASLPEEYLVSIGYSPQMNLRLLSVVRSLSTIGRPKFRLNLISSHTNDQVRALLDGTIQAGLVTLPIKNDSLVVKSLLREPLAVVVPERHLLRGKPDLQPRELNGHPVISMPRYLNPSSYDHLHMLFKKLGYKANVVQEVTTEREVLYMVAEGLGIAFMKASAIPLDQEGIVYYTLRDSSLVEETGIAYRRDNRSERVQEFISLLRSKVRKLATHLHFQHGFQPYREPDPNQLNLF
jgi:DNA-binding transcriptional LysR family regulator